MKAFLTIILTSISLSSTAQIITGFSENNDLFQFNMIGAVSKKISEKKGPSTFYTNLHHQHSEIFCHENIPRLNYRGPKGDELKFKFDDKKKCTLIENCLKKLKKGEIMNVSVHRRQERITHIIIPDSCLTPTSPSDELILDVVL